VATRTDDATLADARQRNHTRRGVERRSLRLALAVSLPLAALAPVWRVAAAQAAGVDPLPAVARALAHVRSYEVTITLSGSGARGARPPRTARGTRNRRGTGVFALRGMRTETVVAVRKGSVFEDYVVFKGTNSAGKPATMELIFYGTKVCRRSSGASSYTCSTMTGSFNFNPDPTQAFTEGAGATTFAQAGTRTIAGQACEGYTYRTADGSAHGIVYLSRATSLPCEQIATVTRRAPTSGATFTQTSTILWSHFNDPALRVPAIPAS
jgi:hypothetical protein